MSPRTVGNLSDVDIAQKSTRGTLVLFVGNFSSTVILAVSSIIIARLLGPASYGSYSLVILVPSIFQLFIGLGVGSAITRYSAYHISRGEVDVARRFSINGMIFLVLFGVMLSLICFASSGFFSAVVLHRKELAPLLQYISIVVLAQTLLQSSTSGLVGWNSMGLASFATILQACVRVSIAPILVISGFGVAGALTGYTAGYLFAGAAAALAFYAFKLHRTVGDDDMSAFLGDARAMVSYGLPIYTGGVVTGLAGYYVIVLVAAIASNAVVGYYQAALNFTAVISVTSSAIVAALFPAFSSLHGIGADTGLAFRHATKYVAYVIAPIILFLAGTSGLVVTILYGHAFSSAGIYLELLALSNLPAVIGLFVVSVFFSGIGRTRLSMAVSALGAGALVALAPLLGVLLDLGVDGLIYAALLSNLFSAVAGVYFASRYLRARADLRAVGAIVGASILGYLAILPLSFLALPEIVVLAADALVFPLAYFTFAPLVGGIEASDVERLGVAIGSLGFFAKLFRPILEYESLILKRLR